MKKSSWFAFSRPEGANPEIVIYDEIGSYGVNAKDFYDELNATIADYKGVVDVRINSYGGEIHQAVAIYNMLKRAPNFIRVHIDGIAASAASFIAMAGDFVIMPENTLMMVHLPSTYAEGWVNAPELEKALSVLTAQRDVMVSIYSAKSGKAPADIINMLTEETWLTAAGAVEAGFADEVVKAIPVAALAGLSQKYPNAPQVATTTELPTMEKDLTAAEVAEAIAKAKAEAVAEAAKRVADISALCALAGRSDKLSEFLASDITADQVREKLIADKAAATDSDTVSTNVINKAAHAEAALTIDEAKIMAKFNGVRTRR